MKKTTIYKLNLIPESIWLFDYLYLFQNEVRKIRVSKRENFTINRLNKTKREVQNPDLRAERENRDKQVERPFWLIEHWVESNFAIDIDWLNILIERAFW